MGFELLSFSQYLEINNDYNSAFITQIVESLCADCSTTKKETIDKLSDQGASAFHALVGTFYRYSSALDLEGYFYIAIRNSMLKNSDLRFDQLDSAMQELFELQNLISLLEAADPRGKSVKTDEIFFYKEKTDYFKGELSSKIINQLADIYHDRIFVEPVINNMFKYSGYISDCSKLYNRMGNDRVSSCENKHRDDLFRMTSINKYVLEKNVENLISLEKIFLKRKGVIDEKVLSALVDFRRSVERYYSLPTNLRGNRLQASLSISQSLRDLDEKLSNLLVLLE